MSNRRSQSVDPLIRLFREVCGDVQHVHKRIGRMQLFLRVDAVEQGARAEREQVEQRRAGVLLDEPRQQVGAFRR